MTAGSELADAIFQTVVTAGLAVFALYLYRRQRATWLAWWAAAWGLYVLRLLAIILFLATDDLIWLFAHQVATGWVALAILRAAMVFAGRAKWRNWYLALAAFPLLLALLAVNSLDRFMLVALPMVVLISGATIGTGVLFWRHARETGSGGARFVAVAFMMWGLHHLDYPFLRARGAWVPWGYFLDVGFELAVGIGFALMVLSDSASRLASRTAELSRLQAWATRVDEGSRQRLARDLHDETAQTLSAVKMEIGLLRESATTPVGERLDHMLTLMDQGIQGVRRAVADLRPPQLDDLGLASALRSLATDVCHRAGLNLELEIDSPLPRMKEEVELAVFRTAQESFTNIVRHADAKRVRLKVASTGGELCMIVSDDGRGFDRVDDLYAFEREGHFGLAGMRERIQGLGGRMTIDGNNGVTLRVEFPVEGVS